MNKCQNILEQYSRLFVPSNFVIERIRFILLMRPDRTKSLRHYTIASYTRELRSYSDLEPVKHQLRNYNKNNLFCFIFEKIK